MRRLIQIVVLLLLLIHVGGPLFETVDCWDQVQQGGDDFVLSVLNVVAGLGLTLMVGFLLRMIVEPTLASSRLNLIPLSRKANCFRSAFQPAPFTSPPLALRI
ncbi:MAG: hypothetical protein M3Y07_16860 [Acidobacteriota bacterium]|nr:hypothetical protein [Acidobacteriota bacterium]